MNRRGFLYRTALGLFASLLPQSGYAGGPYGPLVETIAAPAHARRIGALVLARHIPGQAAAAVQETLSEKFGPPALCRGRSRQDWSAAIAAQIQQDFDVDDCVKIDGWVLSRTEATLFALAALHD